MNILTVGLYLLAILPAVACAIVSYKIYKQIPQIGLLWLFIGYAVGTIFRCYTVYQHANPVFNNDQLYLWLFIGTAVFFLFEFIGLLTIYFVFKRYLDKRDQ